MTRADVMAGRAYVSLYMKQDQLTRGLQNARQNVSKFGSDMMALGTKMVAMSAAIATPIGFSVAKFSEFDDAMRAVKAVSQSTEAQFASMTERAKELGRTTSFTAVQVAQLMTELGRAGFKPDQINVMTAAVMDLARATGTDATLSAGIMASTLRQFALDAGQAAHVADVLTLAANSTFNTVEGLGESLKYAGPVAKELGMSLEDTVAILGSLGNVGIQGSEAGSALRRLSVISAATGKDLKDIFNIDNVDATGQLKPIVQIMDEIGKAVEKLPVAERVAKMNQAFGLLGITSASVLTHAATDTSALAEALRDADGAAAKAAQEMDKGLGGAFRIIMSAVEGLQIAIGEALQGSIQRVTETLTVAIGKTTEWVTKNQEMVVVITSLTIAAGAAGIAILGIGVAAKVAAVGISIAIGVIGAIKTAVKLAMSAFSLFQSVTTGLATLMEAVFTTSVVASTAAVATLATTQVAATAVIIPYGTLTAAAAQATGVLAITSGAATTALIAQSGAMIAASGASMGMIAASGGASAGLITLSGASAVATASTATFTAAGGVMATAWTAVSGVIAAGWAVILAPVTPFVVAAAAIVAVIGTIAAAAGVATLAATDFSAAWTVATGTLSDLLDIAKRVGGVLMDALAGGDYDIAFGVTMQGLKLALATILDSMSELWSVFWNGAWTMLKNFFVQFLGISGKAVAMLARALTNPLGGAAGLAKELATLTESTFNVSLGIDTEKMKSDATAEIDRLEKELEARKAKREADAAAEDAGAAGGGTPADALNTAAEGAAENMQALSAEQTAAAAAAKQVQDAFDSETASIEQQIIALRDGEEAAERFRLQQAGMTEDQISKIMALKAQEEALTKQREAGQRQVSQIQDFADAAYDKNKLSSEDVAKIEKAAIEQKRKEGTLTDQEAEKATAEAEIRKEERDHKERLKKFSGDDGTKSSEPKKLASASAASFSLSALSQLAGGRVETKILSAAEKTVKLNEKQVEQNAQIIAGQNAGVLTHT